MNDDDIKDLIILLSRILEMPTKHDLGYREPGLGTDYDMRIGDFLIKKRRNPYQPDPNPHAA